MMTSSSPDDDSTDGCGIMTTSLTAFEGIFRTERSASRVLRRTVGTACAAEKHASVDIKIEFSF